MAASALIRCLEDALKHKRISKKRGDEIRRLLDEAARRADPAEMAQVNAKLEAIQGRLDHLEWERRAAALQVVVNSRNLADQAAHPRGRGTGMMAKITADVTERARYTNVDRRFNANYRYLRSKLAVAMSKLRTRKLGFTWNSDLMDDVVRGMYAIDGLPARTPTLEGASEIAKAMRETLEDAKGMFNQAGGDIATRRDWALPNYHERRKIMRFDVEEYARDVVPWLDPQRMYDADGLKVSPADLPKIARGAFAEIIAGDTDMPIGLGAVKNRHRHSRSLAFKSAEAYLAYQRKYGTDNVYGALMGHIRTLSRETAMMEILGPNPEAGFRVLYNATAKEKGAGRFGYLSQAKAVWEAVSGQVDRPGSVRVAQIQGGLQDILVMAQLGGATLSSLADQGTSHLTIHYNGLSSVRYMKQMFELMRPGETGEAARIWAARLGLAADAWSRSGVGTGRYLEDILATRKTRVLSEAVMRASLLEAWTDSGRQAFGLEFMATLADMSKSSLDELGQANPRLAKSLERYGWTAREWDALRSVETAGRNGIEFVSIEQIQRSDLSPTLKRELTSKLLSMVDTEMDFAVPVPDARVRGHILFGTRPGTLWGAAARAGAMYKSFPLTMIYRHFMRAWNQESWGQTLNYALKGQIALTMMGTLAYQAKAVARGKEPMDWEDWRLWAAGYMQGGGAGLAGDFLQGMTTDRFGHTWQTTMAGPVVGLADDFIKATTHNFGQAVEGRDPNAVDDWLRLVGRYTPGSSIWYLRAAWDRMVVDQLRLMNDPARAKRSFVASERFEKERAGRGFWWRPGHVTPGR